MLLLKPSWYFANLIITDYAFGNVNYTQLQINCCYPCQFLFYRNYQNEYHPLAFPMTLEQIQIYRVLFQRCTSFLYLLTKISWASVIFWYFFLQKVNFHAWFANWIYTNFLVSRLLQTAAGETIFIKF